LNFIANVCRDPERSPGSICCAVVHTKSRQSAYLLFAGSHLNPTLPFRFVDVVKSAVTLSWVVRLAGPGRTPARQRWLETACMVLFSGRTGRVTAEIMI
jgi:hypothetical protein